MPTIHYPILNDTTLRASQELAVSLVMGTLSESGQRAVLAELHSKATETVRAHLKNETEKYIKRATVIEMLKAVRDGREFNEARPDWGSW